MSPVSAFPGRVIFDHLPKTGGQAIRAWLTAELGDGCVSPHVDGVHGHLVRQFGGSHSILCSHLSYENAEGLDPRYQYVTLFREPLDRLVSWLYFVLTNHEEAQLTQLIPAVRRFLDSEGDDLDPELRPHLCNLYVEHFCRVDGLGHEPDAERLALALAAVSRYDVVGVHDHMPRFLAALAALLELPSPARIAQVNVTRQRPAVDAIPARLRQRLAALNQLDLQLYREVYALVHARAPGTPALGQARWQPYRRRGARVLSTPALLVAPVAPRAGPQVRYGQTVHFDIDFLLNVACPDLLVGIHLYDADQRLAYGTNGDLLNQPRMALEPGPHRICYQWQAWLPAGLYQVGFAFVAGPHGERELAWLDAACSLEVSHASPRRALGYAELDARLTRQTVAGARTDLALRQAAGAMHLHALPDTVPRGQEFTVAVDIANRSPQHWQGDPFRPVMLSYHWLRPDGSVLIYEGLRTPLPCGGVVAGAALSTTLQVQAPSAPGDYQLQLTLVQEHVAWLETLGFEPALGRMSIA